MEDKIYAYRCSNCGAITVTCNEFTNSMPIELFKKNFKNLRISREVINCDYCINHWGIDLCGCGSGEKLGKCENDFYECRHNIPAQVLFTQKDMSPKFF